MDEFKIRVVPRPWNKGKLVGQKAPLRLKEIWAIRVRPQVFRRNEPSQHAEEWRPRSYRNLSGLRAQSRRECGRIARDNLRP
jgi:hypothetical protein